ncbi:hypothetical protein [Gimesia fumaroli]|uniref:Uncharacterized protein n=1 Tax=Gimesia fumaroli TaxID=2527976 RepID=A0A518IAM5_9PLAN|nr:hypothetical protein [Gimesia fumaroli]QDV50135.1 hypothetical protein Enr17x_21730 [Gimesia fumaroli]
MVGRTQIIKGALILFLVALISSLILLVVILQNSFRAMREFSDLWNTSDTLMHYVRQQKKWPEEFENLNETFPVYRPGFNAEDMVSLKEQVEVNFDIDFSQPARSDEWFVRLKSGRMPLEQKNANGSHS